MTRWTEICELIAAGETARLTTLLVALTEEERADLSGLLPGLVKDLRRLRAEQVRAEDPDEAEFLASWEVGEMLDKLAPALLLAGVGLITGPAAAVAWMTSRDVNRRWADTPNLARVCRVAAARPAAWRHDVAVRLAQRIRRPADRIAPIALALLRTSGATPPEHDPLVAAWLSEPIVVKDPLAPVLLPRVFEAEGAGRALREERLDPLPSRWLATAARDLPRQQALDGCVSRFLRGGDAQDLRFFVRLHTLLDPSPAESAPRLRDYLRLLPSAPGTVAELAAEQVRKALPLDHADLVEAVDALTFREEAKLAALGLRWLGQALRATPETAGDFVTALVTAYTHKSFDVRTRAVELTSKHAGLFAGHASTILDGAGHLPADLAAKLAARFGGEVPVEDLPARKELPPLPALPELRPFPEPSLAANHETTWVREEGWLAAFVAGGAAGRAAFSPQIEGGPAHWASNQARTEPAQWRAALAAELVTPGSVRELPPFEPEKFWDRPNHTLRVRRLTRGQEPDPETGMRFMISSSYRPGRYLDDDAPMRAIFLTWTSDDGPGAAVATEGDRQIPFADGRIHLYGPQGMPPDALYDDSDEAMPDFILDRAFDRMAELGVDPLRIAAMRAGKPLPPPEPDEPLVEVTVIFVPARLRSFMHEPLPEHEEWRRRNQLPRPNSVTPLHDFQLHRYAELLDALRNDALPPVLLATPSWLSGHLEPDVLVDRLETCAAAGVEPLPADLAQALLRLPRGSHPAAADRAAKIDSAGARSAARWLAGDGLADPECGLVWRHMEGATMVEFGDGEPEHFTSVRLKPVLRVTTPTGHPLIDEVLLREPYDWPVDDYGDSFSRWSGTLPSHREVLSVNCLPYLLRGGWGHSVGPAEIASLPLTRGPLGEATAAILAFQLVAGLPGAIPLILTLAAADDLPAEAMGRQIALMLRRTWLEVRPAITALTQLAEAGGHHAVWRILGTLLPALLPGPGQRATVTHSELVALAADVALWTDARGELPVIAQHAGSRRTTRFAHECRRLHAQLTGGAS
ncbi:hypothetical protein [Nonomuraea sp. NPDC050310]|uniref:hypothetical protein n=1 Tax=Nonomuraea sp. NPDC050310 TaxID=3154935 RepID=UPI0033ED05EA